LIAYFDFRSHKCIDYRIYSKKFEYGYDTMGSSSCGALYGFDHDYKGVHPTTTGMMLKKIFRGV